MSLFDVLTWLDWLALFIAACVIAWSVYLFGRDAGRDRENRRLQPHRWTTMAELRSDPFPTRCECFNDQPTCSRQKDTK